MNKQRYIEIAGLVQEENADLTLRREAALTIHRLLQSMERLELRLKVLGRADREQILDAAVDAMLPLQVEAMECCGPSVEEDEIPSIREEVEIKILRQVLGLTEQG